MRELELDGIHDDGEHVVLIDSDGERYTLRIDEALRAAVRRDRPALGMIQAAGSAPLRPREIQAMLRSGRSAEDIAEAAEVPIDHVRRYEGPVLAEREWTAERARTFPVGRGGPSLAEVVTERLAARQASRETVWDAWRRDDGTWTLELSFSAGGRTRQAHWVADLESRSVRPVDDEAGWISDEDSPPEPVRGRTRLMAVRSSVYDLEADGSFDENAPRERRGPWSSSGSGAPSSEHPSAIDDRELDALNARRGLRPVPAPPTSGDSPTVWSSLEDEIDAPTDGSAPEADLEAELEHAGESSPDSFEHAPEEASESEDPAAEEDRAEQAPATDPPAGPEVHHEDTVDLTPLPGFDEEPPVDGEESGPRGPQKSSKNAKNKRASMPSWDEIVFGSSKQD